MHDKKLDWDFRKFEAVMEKEISNRKMLGNLSSTSKYSELGIMDQFFIFGISPIKQKQPRPTILAAFPPFIQSSIPVENVLSLSMPNWDMSSSNSKHKFSNMFPLFSIDKNGTPSCENGIIDEFVFQYNAGETKMYGVCAHIQPSKANRNASLPFFASDMTKRTIFCMCLISKLPIFNAHFTFLNYLAGLSSGTVLSLSTNTSLVNSLENSYENNYENNYRVEHEMQNDTLIEGLDLCGGFGQDPNINIPEEFQAKIFEYYSKTMYSSPSKLAPGYNIHYPPPSTPTAKLLLWAALDTLFSVLAVDDILELLTALILDAQVLIIGSSMQEVSMTVYGLSSLLTPFNYCGIVMPIIPNNDDYLDLLSSPTPYIFGMPNIPKLKKMSFLESTYIVNLDKHKVPPVNFFPKYPNFDNVVKKINELITMKEETRNKTENDLLELGKNMKERSRSAIVGVDGITGNRQIRIKPNFAPACRRNNNTISKLVPTEKLDSINSSEKVVDTNEDKKDNMKEKVQDDKKDENEESHNKVEINGKIETIESIPNFSAIQTTSIRRSYTFNQNDFPSDTSPSPLSPPAQISISSSFAQKGPSSQPLYDFPVFRKPVSIANDFENDVNPYKFPTDLTKRMNHKVLLSRETIEKIIDALHEPLDFIFSDLLNCYFVTNALENITIFNQALFLASVKQEDLPFYEFLLESQTFQDYVETKLNEFTVSKASETGQRRMSTYGPKTKRRISTMKKPFSS
ncbi:hypothetical protein M9Y10_015106 [Tritrichomonas musculus]|uniref:UDENN domain-containing protein n=1 Tax=Tritrichomonas musculus TaxID=1915356 RepID=A0ABR2L1D7_9EUKA